ncbi:MAG: sigma-54-dependent transcriptional regulator [Bacteroidales bacterium]
MTRNITILIVDDERYVRDSLHQWFTDDGYEVSCAKNAREALSMMQVGSYDIVLADIKMPGMDGIELNRRIQTLTEDAVVIIMTAFASVDTAVQAMKDGAYDYITKPFDPEDLSKLIRKISYQILNKVEKKTSQIREIDLENTDHVIGNSKAMFGVLKRVKAASKSNSPVLITGEKGTGKEMLARLIHANSSRKYFPMLSVHCGALSGDLARSELFGHEKGAMPGALIDRSGHFEEADGGTVLLDEISAVSMEIQLKLLQVIESKTFSRIGGKREINSDFRLICTTKENLKEQVLKQNFREDLYYRLNIASIHIPPLRERREDVPLLVDHFIEKYCNTMSREKVTIAESTLKQLQEYDFPGNIRELENMIERAILLCDGREIRMNDLPIDVEEKDHHFESLEEHEKKHILAVLNEYDWNISKSARTLQVDRVTLYNKIKKYRMEPVK